MYGIFVGSNLRLIRKPSKCGDLLLFKEEEDDAFCGGGRRGSPERDSSCRIDYNRLVRHWNLYGTGMISSKLNDFRIEEMYRGIAYVELHGDSQESFWQLRKGCGGSQFGRARLHLGIVRGIRDR